MAPTLVSQQGFGDNAASSSTVWGPGSSPALAAITPGNTLVILFRAASGATGQITAVSDTGGNTWVIPDPPAGGITSVSNTLISCAYVHNAAQPGTITITNGNNAGRLVKLLEFSDVTGAPDVAAEDFTNAASTTDIRSAAGTTTVVGDFIIGFASTSSTAAYPTGAGGGFTLLTSPPATGGRLMSAYKIGTVAQSEQALFTGVVGQSRFGAGLIAFKAKKHGSDTGALTIATTVAGSGRKRGHTTGTRSIVTALSAVTRKRGITLGPLTIATAASSTSRKRGHTTGSLAIATALTATTRKRGHSTAALAISTTLAGTGRKRGITLGPLTIHVVLSMTGGPHLDLDFPPERGGVVAAATRGSTVAATTRGGYVPPDDRGHE